MPSLPSLVDSLAGVLSTVRTPGEFHVAGQTELHLPNLVVAGVGPVALPLLPVQARTLIAVAERAPYGLGERTLVDAEVRRTWQISADQVQIGGKHWAKTLQSIIAKVAAGLGVRQEIAADLYKMLVYDEGSFFVNHRDTEKAPGMFATLVVALPSVHTGGELLVRHGGQEVQLALDTSDPSVVAFGAFYADCVHEVRPVTSGCRLVLVYNLRRVGSGRIPKPPNYDKQVAQLDVLLRGWESPGRARDELVPLKLVYPLEHAYSLAELSFDALKGADAGAAAVLRPAAARGGCDLYLALMRIEESGSAEYSGYSRYSSSGRGRYSDHGDDDFEIGEVFERRATLSRWIQPDGQPAPFGVIPFENGELSPANLLQEMDPDEQHFQEATGNEGASFDRSYQRAALVLWPHGGRIAVLSQAGLGASLPYLGDLARRWAASGTGQESASWQEAHELARHMLQAWPPSAYGFRETEGETDAARMLVLLTRLKDVSRIESFLTGVSASGIYCKGDNTALLRAAKLMGSARSAELIDLVIAGNAAANFAGCADLLTRAAEAISAVGRRAGLRAAAMTLLNAVPGAPEPQRTALYRVPANPVDATSVADLMTAASLIDSGLAEHAAARLLAWPADQGIDALLLPAVCRLREVARTRDDPAVERLRAACLAHLRARMAQPLEAPRDWTRANKLRCACPYCTALGAFLARPDQKQWTLKAAETHRAHVSRTISENACDADVATVRTGRPHSLVCTKSQASYERRVKQRKQDIEWAAKLS